METGQRAGVFPLSAQSLGIEIGGTKLQIVTGDGSGRISERRRFRVQPAQGAEGIRRQLETGIHELMHGREVSSLGVGFGGPVDWRSGRICRSHQIEGWSDFDLRGWLEKLTKAKVLVDNDANVAALGEVAFGAGRGRDSVFYVTLGSGVGGGLVLGGKIYHGVLPGEAEIGHVRLDRTGMTVESRCSGWAVDHRIREEIKKSTSSELARLCADDHGGEAKHLLPALMKGDGLASRILNELAQDLAFGLSHVVHLFHPEIIILGGGLAQIVESLRTRVAENLREQVMEVFAPTVQVALTDLHEDAVPVGALSLCAGASQHCPQKRTVRR